MLNARLTLAVSTAVTLRRDICCGNTTCAFGDF